MSDRCYDCRFYRGCPCDLPGEDCVLFEPSSLPEDRGDDE